MEQIQEQIAQLEARIQQVIQAQEQQNAEILQLISALQALKQQSAPSPININPEPVNPQPIPKPFVPAPKPKSSWFNESDKTMEDLIGRNLINRIGILITVIGVFIGAKYAIDKNLIIPTLRIILGYIMSGALAGVALYLRKKYLDYSAVLMSGAVTVFYFITYIGFSFYQLFPQLAAFGLMFIATALAVGTALWYNNRFIALMGQIGAYAIPFLLSTGTGNVMFLLAYMCVVNVGLLVLSFRKDWRQIYQIAFYLSWLIYVASNPWQDKQYSTTLKISVLSAQMLIFYAAFLSYKLLKQEAYKIQELVVLLLNAVLYYVIGQAVLNAQSSSVLPVTIFALSNAVLHFVAGILIMKRAVHDKSLHLFLLGLGISFLTVSIPVAFKGNVITILWAVEAVVLGLVAKRSAREVYVYLAYALVVLTLISLLMDWKESLMLVESKVVVHAFFNKYFISSLVAVASFGLVYQSTSKLGTSKIGDYVLPLLFIASGYATFIVEMDHLWKIRSYDKAFFAFHVPASLVFTHVYFSIWHYLNHRTVKHKGLEIVLFVVSIYITFYSLVIGLNSLGDLRTLYLTEHVGGVIPMLGFRYVFFASLSLLVYQTYKGFSIADFDKHIHRAFFIALNITTLSILGNEFIHWMEIAGKNDQYALGLSIISGVYALVLLFVGIRKQLQYIRISAIVLLGLTLIKLFLYDLAGLSTISKTVVLIILGIILLIASFLYTKYKEAILGEEKA